MDICADGKFAPSKIAPDKYTKKYPRRRRNRWAECYSDAKNHTQNLGSAIGIVRDADVHAYSGPCRATIPVDAGRGV